MIGKSKGYECSEHLSFTASSSHWGRTSEETHLTRAVSLQRKVGFQRETVDFLAAAVTPSLTALAARTAEAALRPSGEQPSEPGLRQQLSDRAIYCTSSSKWGPSSQRWLGLGGFWRCCWQNKDRFMWWNSEIGLTTGCPLLAEQLTDGGVRGWRERTAKKTGTGR